MLGSIFIITCFAAVGIGTWVACQIGVLIKLLSAHLDTIDEIREEAEQPPDSTAQMPDNAEQGLTDLLGSEMLHIKNAEHDRKIKELIDELEGKHDAGQIYDVPHVDYRLNQNGEEYAE